jgi:hypothetical protein
VQSSSGPARSDRTAGEDGRDLRLRRRRADIDASSIPLRPHDIEALYLRDRHLLLYIACRKFRVPQEEAEACCRYAALGEKTKFGAVDTEALIREFVLRDLVQRLRARDRELLRLHYFEALTVPAIAAHEKRIVAMSMNRLAVEAVWGTEKWNRMMTRIADDDTGLERQAFRDDKLELFVWSRIGAIKGFKLPYAIHTANEWSIRCTEDEGMTFQRVDPYRVNEGRNDFI